MKSVSVNGLWNGFPGEPADGVRVDLDRGMARALVRLLERDKNLRRGDSFDRMRKSIEQVLEYQGMGGR